MTQVEIQNKKRIVVWDYNVKLISFHQYLIPRR